MRAGPAIAAALTALAWGCRIGTEARMPARMAPRLVVTPESLAFRGQVGDTALPDQYLSLSLDAGAPGRWYGSENGSWMFIPTVSDTLPFFLPVAVRPAGLPAGSYGADVWIVSANDTVGVPVTLQLDSAPSLTGRWVAAPDSARIVLDVSDSSGVVVGSATASPSARTLEVAGTRSGTSVSLTLAAVDETFRFAGSLVRSDLLVGRLSGAGVSDLPVTFFRQ